MGVDVNNDTILYFLDYGKEFGGAANTLIQQAILARRAGYKAILFFSNYIGAQMHNEYKEICESLEIEYEWAAYQIASQPEDIDVVCLYENYEKLRDTIASYQPDLLHSVQINSCVELISRELGIPHIMNIYPLLSDFFTIQYMNIFPYYHICDSWFYAHKWQQYLHTDSVCIRTVVNEKTVGGDKFSKPFLRLICVGSIYKKKNQLAVIRAFHRALQSGIRGRLTLCGYVQGDYGRECVQYIEENGLQQDVIIKGFCSDMNYEYSQQDVLICGSTRESYPNAISEAMANGLVVISTPVAGVPEIIVDGENGYLTGGYSADALYEKLMQVQAGIKSGGIKNIIIKTEETFRINHSPEAVMKQLVQYYQHVMEDFRRGSKIECDRESVSISAIRTFFKPLLEKFYNNRENFSDPDKVALKLWYLYHIQGAVSEALRRNSTFFIWGTGKYGIVVKEMVEIFMPEVQVAGFLDSYQTGKFKGCRIYQPDEILKRENTVIFVAVLRGQEEVIEQLEERGYCCNREYFILSARSW